MPPLYRLLASSSERSALLTAASCSALRVLSDGAKQQPIDIDGRVMSCDRLIGRRPALSGVEHRFDQGSPQGPDAAGPLDQSRDSSAFESPRSGERNIRVVSG